MKTKVDIADTAAKLMASFLHRELLLPLLARATMEKINPAGQMSRIQTSHSHWKTYNSTLPCGKLINQYLTLPRLFKRDCPINDSSNLIPNRSRTHDNNNDMGFSLNVCYQHSN
jgi:hypothetical protein